LSIAAAAASGKLRRDGQCPRRTPTRSR
jgi:hypothetical protein